MANCIAVVCSLKFFLAVLVTAFSFVASLYISFFDNPDCFIDPAFVEPSDMLNGCTTSYVSSSSPLSNVSSASSSSTCPSLNAPKIQMTGLEKLFEGKLFGAESFAEVPPSESTENHKYRLFTGLSDGRIVEILSDTEYRNVTLAAEDYKYANVSAIIKNYNETKGEKKQEEFRLRPLGMKWDKLTGKLFVCDAFLGLLAVDVETGQIEILTNQVENSLIRFPNSLDIIYTESDGGKIVNGYVYFTDCSRKFSYDVFMKEALEGRPNGRILMYDIRNKQTFTIKENLAFPNGLIKSFDGKSILLVEIMRLRIWQIDVSFYNKKVYTKDERMENYKNNAIEDLSIVPFPPSHKIEVYMDKLSIMGDNIQKNYSNKSYLLAGAWIAHSPLFYLPCNKLGFFLRKFISLFPYEFFFRNLPLVSFDFNNMSVAIMEISSESNAVEKVYVMQTEYNKYSKNDKNSKGDNNNNKIDISYHISEAFGTHDGHIYIGSWNPFSPIIKWDRKFMH